MKGKELYLEIKSTPDSPGYPDQLIVSIDDHLVYSCPASGSPNWRAPWRKGGLNWIHTYGWLAAGDYPFEVVRYWRHLRQIRFLLCGGGSCPSRTSNPRHDGAKYLDELYMHSGSSDSWRGSAGCPTVAPRFYMPLLSFFKVGDIGTLHVRDTVEGVCPVCLNNESQ